MGEDTTKIEIAAALFDEGKYEEAFKKYLDLAQCDVISAQLFIGWMYHAGKGVKQNLDEAFRWYKKAAENESQEAQFYLATLYRSKHEYQEAIEWFKKSASKGYLPALYRLGKMYDIGEGVNKDEKRAFEYLEQAAKMGHVFARREIAVKLINGRQGIMNIFKALYMFVRVLYDAAKLDSKNPDSDMLRK